jgi:hypothetical protein
MHNDEIEELFLGAIETFPAEIRDAADDWLTQRILAHAALLELVGEDEFDALLKAD